MTEGLAHVCPAGFVPRKCETRTHCFPPDALTATLNWLLKHDRCTAMHAIKLLDFENFPSNRARFAMLRFKGDCSPVLDSEIRK